MDELFIGSALSEVTSNGEILLPSYFHQTVLQRCADQALYIGLHETSACLVAFDRPYVQQLYYEREAYPQAEDPQCLRRTYGFVERTSLEPDGMIALPALMRERGHIGTAVLLVATGQRFEIWDLETLLQGGPSDLILLATHHRMVHIANEVMHVPALPASPSRHRADDAIQSGVFLRSVPAVRPRHDPIRCSTVAKPVEKGSRGISRDAA